MVPHVGLLLELVADVAHVPRGAEVVAGVDDLLHGDEVDDALELVLRANGQLDDERRGAEHLHDHVLAA